MAIQISGQNLKTQNPGPPFPQDQQGAVLVTENHGRFYEQTYLGNCYSIGCTLTALTAATILLTSSAQPIVGVWNPPTSTVNLVILQLAIQDQLNTLTATAAPGTFVWASSTGNSALTAGLAPFNRKTLTNAGSQAKAFALSTASLLTGLTNNVVVIEPADIPLADAFTGTITVAGSEIPSAVGVQNVDGALIVPPGGVMAVLNTVSSTTHSVAGRLMWEEVPL
jgi:hypothetical protein